MFIFSHLNKGDNEFAQQIFGTFTHMKDKKERKRIRIAIEDNKFFTFCRCLKIKMAN